MDKKLRASQLWYAPERYNEVKAMMADGDLLPDAYGLWKEWAEQREEQARSNGAEVFRVPFDPGEFRRFCAHFTIPIDTKARHKPAVIITTQMCEDSN